MYVTVLLMVVPLIGFLVKSKSSSDEQLRDELRSLPVQGRLIEEAETVSEKTWATAVKKLLEQVMNFALDAVCDTLPHKVNLKRWKSLPLIIVHCVMKGKLFSTS